jgi:hypothetical protein
VIKHHEKIVISKQMTDPFIGPYTI